MSDLAVLAQPGALDQYADAGEFVIHSCERAKDWLVQCINHGDIEQIVELKSQAEAIRVYTTTKQLGRDAELAAAEIVRRAERGIGVCIRKGQEAGEIAGQATSWLRRADRSVDNTSIPLSPSDFIPKHELAGNGAGIYAITDGVTDEQFEEALSEAKAESNLTRANVVRKVKAITNDTTTTPGRVSIAKRMAAEGATSNQIADAIGIQRKNMSAFRARHGIDVPADAVVGRNHRINPERIIDETISMLEGIASGLALIEDVSSLDAEKRLAWLDAIAEPLSAINRFKKELAR